MHYMKLMYVGLTVDSQYPINNSNNMEEDKMNIIEAMEYVKEGKEIRLYDKIIKLNSNGNLVRTYYRDYKVKAEEIYTPSIEDMLSDDWELGITELPNGSVVRIHETDLVVHTGYRGRKYLIDPYNHTIVFEYENEGLMLIDIDRRGGALVWR